MSADTLEYNPPSPSLLLSEFGLIVNFFTGVYVIYFILIALLAASLGIILTWQFSIMVVLTIIAGIANYYAGKWS